MIGAGATLLVATFLILAEKSLMIVNGRRREVQVCKNITWIKSSDVVICLLICDFIV